MPTGVDVHPRPSMCGSARWPAPAPCRPARAERRCPADVSVWAPVASVTASATPEVHDEGMGGTDSVMLVAGLMPRRWTTPLACAAASASHHFGQELHPRRAPAAPRRARRSRSGSPPRTASHSRKNCGRFTGVEQGQDVGMLQLCRDLDLMIEPLGARMSRPAR